MGRPEKVLVPFAAPIARVAPVTQAKSTLLVSSVLSLREHGHFEAYRRHLDDAFVEVVLHTPAGVWLPVAAAEAHYRACDALGLSPDTIVSIGRSVHASAQRSVLAVSMRVAREAGVTPWLVMKVIPKLWARLYVGGETSLVELGPKEARIDIVGAGLARFGYWRTGLRGIIAGILDPFATRTFVREAGYRGSGENHLLSYRVSWA